MIDNFLGCIRKSFHWKGRAGRREFWSFVLASAILTFPLAVASVIFEIGPIVWLDSIVRFVLLPAMFAVGVRRLHDTGRGATWAVACVVTTVISLVLLMFLAEMGYDVVADGVDEPTFGLMVLVVFVFSFIVWFTAATLMTFKSDFLPNRHGDP